VQIARHLGRDQPVYGLQDPLFDDDGYSRLSISAFAEIYVDAIRRLQPDGPYHLLGWSFGGIIAFEMAQQLRRRGQPVGLLALLDTPSPDASAPFVDDDANRYRILIGMVREQAWIAGKEMPPLPPPEVAGWSPVDRVAYFAEQLKSIGAMRPDADPSLLFDRVERHWSRTSATQEYQAGMYPGCITLFRALDGDEEVMRRLPEATQRILREPTLGWSKLSSRPVDVHDVPGKHQTMGSEPYVGVLAKQLAACLD
jgi:thioesterase domain-containing protein